MSSFRIRIAAKNKPAEDRDISDSITTLGREEGDIVIGDPLSSSRHAELLWSDGQLTLHDLNSTNGTFLRGERVQQRVLMAGDVFTIGGVAITILHLSTMTAGGTLVAQPQTTRSNTPLALPSVAAMNLAVAPTMVRPAVQVAAKAETKPRSGTPLLAAAVGALVVAAVGTAAYVRSDKPPATPTAVAATTTTAPSRDGEAVVKAVWFKSTTPAQGGTSDVNVRVQKNPNDGASVGVIEQFAGGTGDTWRTATWLAAFNASRAVGTSLVDHEYLVRAGGHIDGPSAGMLMTATMMALLRDKKVDPLATMTGTVNPDGSAGPVGGVPQKMQGAKESGIKRFGYPMGGRNQVDMNTKANVDLHEVGATLGMEVKEIHDLYEAYEFLTGDVLSRPKPVTESAMELDNDTVSRLRAKVSAWKGRVDKEVAIVNEMARKNPTVAKMFGNALPAVIAEYEAAKRWEKSDMPVPAYTGYVTTTVNLVMMREVARLLMSLLARDIAGVDSQAKEAAAIGARVAAFGQEAALNAKRTSVGGQVNAASAMVAYVQAESHRQISEERVASVNAALEDARAGKIKPADLLQFMFERMRDYLTHYHAAEALLEAARDNADLAGDQGSQLKADLPRLRKEAAAYGSGAGAGLSYFQALFTSIIGETKKTGAATIDSYLARKEPSYDVARREVMLTERGEGLSPAMGLAAGLDAYLTSATLVNKYYSLGASEAPDGTIIIGQRKALIAQLEQAKLHALEAASRAQDKAGFIPTAAKLEYQAANANREGDDAAKLEALQMYWSAAYWCELAAQLAG
jgi:uncharacterized protein